MPPSAIDPALPAPPPTLVEDGRWSRWDFVLALVMGAALLLFGWVDTRSFLASRHKMPFTFSLNARPGGFRMEPDQEIFRNAFGDSVRLENFSGLEVNRKTFRHALGPVSTLEIKSPHRQAQLSFRFGNSLADQDLVIACNGQPLEHFTHLSTEGEIARLYPLTLQPGSNVVTFTWRRYYNDGDATRALHDSRTIAGTFGSLDLLFE